MAQDNGTDALAQTYARSLFELAQEAGQTDAIAQELSGLVDLIETDPKFSAMLAHRTIAAERRAQSLDRIFKGRVSGLTHRFLRVLNDKGRLEHLSAIRQAYDSLAKAARGEVDVVLTTAQELDAAQLATVTERVSAALGRKAVLQTRTEAALIGGMTLRVGDRLIDASVAARLRRMGRQLAERGREAARTADAS